MGIRGKSFLLIVVAYVVLMAVAIPYGVVQFRRIESDTLDEATARMRLRLDQALSAKEDVWLTNALQVANNPSIVQAMVAGDREAAGSVLTEYGRVFRENTNFANVAVHLIDVNRRSFVKSWDLTTYGEDLSYSAAYREAIEQGEAVVTMEVASSGLRMKGVFPIRDENRIVGAASFEGGLNSIKRDLYDGGLQFLYFLDRDLLSSAPSLTSAPKVGEYVLSQSDVDDDFLSYVSDRLDIAAALAGYHFDGEYLTVVAPATTVGGRNTGVYVVAQDRDSVTALLYQNRRLIVILFIAFGVLVVLFGVFFLVILAVWVVRPLSHVLVKTRYLADGDLTVTFQQERDDEIGHLVKAVGSMSDRIRDVLTNIRLVTERVRAGTQAVASSSQSLSQGASEQAASVEQTSASVEEMASQISQNAENATQLEKTSRAVADQAEETGEVVNEAVASMRRIADRIGVIEQIAGRTNLLALNASIEAARAGEAGKGFAVVAHEVRNLADQSRRAASEITQLARETVETAEQAGTGLNALVPEIRRTNDLVAEITATSREQSAGAEQINRAVRQLDQVVQSNAAAAEELASTSQELEGQFGTLEDTVNFFHGGSSEAAEVAGINFATIRFKHLEWKSRLRAFLAGEGQLSREEAVSDRDCALGQWYFGPGLERFGHLEAMQRIEKPHQRLHELVRQIIDLAGEGKMTEAQEHLDELAPLSDDIVELLHEVEAALRREAHR